MNEIKHESINTYQTPSHWRSTDHFPEINSFGLYHPHLYPTSECSYNPVQCVPTPAHSSDNKNSLSKEQQKLNGRKKKRRRILFTKQQITILEQRFHIQHYLSSSERELLAKHIGLTSNQCKIWFQNHRYKLKRSKQEPSSSYQQSIRDVSGQEDKFLYTSSSYNAYMSSFGYPQYSTNNSYENLFRQQPQTTSWS